MTGQESIHLLIAKLQETSRAVTTYMGDLDYEAFSHDLKTQDAVMMRLVSIGELVNRLEEKSPDFIANTPQVPWNRMRGMRNRIAHDYFGIHRGRLFQIAKVFVPQLIDMMGELLSQQPKSSEETQGNQF